MHVHNSMHPHTSKKMHFILQRSLVPVIPQCCPVGAAALVNYVFPKEPLKTTPIIITPTKDVNRTNFNTERYGTACKSYFEWVLTFTVSANNERSQVELTSVHLPVNQFAHLWAICIYATD